MNAPLAVLGKGEHLPGPEPGRFIYAYWVQCRHCRAKLGWLVSIHNPAPEWHRPVGYVYEDGVWRHNPAIQRRVAYPLYPPLPVAVQCHRCPQVQLIAVQMLQGYGGDRTKSGSLKTL